MEIEKKITTMKEALLELKKIEDVVSAAKWKRVMTPSGESITLTGKMTDSLTSWQIVGRLKGIIPQTIILEFKTARELMSFVQQSKQ